MRGSICPFWLPYKVRDTDNINLIHLQCPLIPHVLLGVSVFWLGKEVSAPTPAVVVSIGVNACGWLVCRSRIVYQQAGSMWLSTTVFNPGMAAMIINSAILLPSSCFTLPEYNTTMYSRWQSAASYNEHSESERVNISLRASVLNVKALVKRFLVSCLA